MPRADAERAEVERPGAAGAGRADARRERRCGRDGKTTVADPVGS